MKKVGRPKGIPSEKLIDITGQRFGTWTVIGRAPDYKNGWVRWHCKCDCGVERDIASHALRTGITFRCGCSGGRYKGLPPGEAAFNKMYSRQRSDGKRLGRGWEITKEQYRILTKGNCHYCGKPPRHVRKDDKTFHGGYLCNGIDRVDNTKGYVIDNCVPCCWECNSMKHAFHVNHFIDHVHSIVKHIEKEKTECVLGHMAF